MAPGELAEWIALDELDAEARINASAQRQSDSRAASRVLGRKG